MSTLTPLSARAVLTDLGWSPRVGYVIALQAFQRGWNLGPALHVDGICGPLTSAALEQSKALHERGLPTASRHFSFAEFGCGCQATLRGCAGIWVQRGLLAGLEQLRAHFYPAGLTVRSGCRCPLHNARVGGAGNSQHLYGAAVDVDYAASTASVAALRAFSGIGYSAATGLVRHVDVRHLSGHNTTSGTTGTPTTWPYAA